MSRPGESEPKIIVDEDWKSRVEAEKLAAASMSKSAEPQATEPAAAGATGDVGRPREMPPATLSFLITTLATQAMVAMGDVTIPISGKTEVRLPEARHFIDALAMLEQKTAGNRTPEESALLDGFLHQLRMAFIEQNSARGKT